MKIMMIEPLGDGGIAHYTYNLLNALSLNNVDCQLFTTFDYEFQEEAILVRSYRRMFRLAGIVVRLAPWLSKEYPLQSLFRRMLKVVEYPFNIVEAIFICKSKKIKCVHFQSVNLIEIVFIMLLKVFRIKVIYTVHNVMPLHRKLKGYHKILYHWIYKLCDQVVIHTRKGKGEIIRYFKVAPNKVNIIFHGNYKFFIPQTRFSKENAKDKLGISSEYRTILFFGAIRENKGLEQILIALPEIMKSIFKVKLMIVGEPTENYNKYKNIINQNNIVDNVYERLEYIPNKDIPLYFYASDLVVLPYHEITGSGVLQVAYAFAKPVVASELNGFREYIANGKNGYLVPVGQTKILAEKIVDILQDDAKIERMGRYSEYLADTRFSWQGIAKKTKRVYDRVCC